MSEDPINEVAADVICELMDHFFFQKIHVEALLGLIGTAEWISRSLGRYSMIKKTRSGDGANSEPSAETLPSDLTRLGNMIRSENPPIWFAEHFSYDRANDAISITTETHGDQLSKFDRDLIASVANLAYSFKNWSWHSKLVDRVFDRVV